MKFLVLSVLFFVAACAPVDTSRVAIQYYTIKQVSEGSWTVEGVFKETERIRLLASSNFTVTTKDIVNSVLNGLGNISATDRFAIEQFLLGAESYVLSVNNNEEQAAKLFTVLDWIEEAALLKAY